MKYQLLIIGCFLLLVIGTISLVTSPSVSFLSWHLVVADEPSLNRSLRPGALLVSRRQTPTRLQTEQLVAFFHPYVNDSVVVRRLKSVAGSQLMTATDSPNQGNWWLVDKQYLIGQIVSQLPYLGYGVQFIRSNFGIVLFILLPSIVIIAVESRQLIRHYALRELKPAELASPSA